VTVETHVHVGLDEDGDPVRAFRTLEMARHAVESESYNHAEIVDYWPDVPLTEVDDER